MDTPAAPAAPKTLDQQLPKSWEDYFPLVNKAIMFVVLILAVILVTGIDITGSAGRSKLGARGSQSAISTNAVSAGSNFKLSSLSVTGPGGWKVIVGLIVGLASITGIVFAVLSTSGLDAAWSKEQEAKQKEKDKPKKTAASGSTDAESSECNLTSYKMFFAPKEEPAAPSPEAVTPVASTST